MQPEVLQLRRLMVGEAVRLDRAMFRGGEDDEQAELHRIADAGCRAFLSLYRQP
jgi:hypothetical protein